MMFRNWALLVSFMVVTGVAHSGQTDLGLEKCAQMSNPAQRLSCFDELTSDRGLSHTNELSQSVESKWETDIEVDPLTDKNIYLATLEADSGPSRFDLKPWLTIRCRDDKTELYIVWVEYLGSRDVSAMYRLDQEPAQTGTWHISTNGRAAFFPRPVPFLKELIATESTSFVVRITPYREAPATAIFDVSGAAEALADIRKGCNW